MSKQTIFSDCDSGSVFCDNCIDDHCNKENYCYTNDPSHLQNEFHSEYLSSLYVNTNEPMN